VSGIERTLVIFKPDAVVRSLVGRLTGRFEDAGLKIIGIKMKQIDEEFAGKHYFDLAERRGVEVFNAMVDFMSSGPVVALVLEGVDAVPNVRRIVGATIPSEAAPGTIRGDFAHQTQAYGLSRGKAIPNLVHASGNAEEAAMELKLWFDESELFSYQTAAEPFTL
jgi:nucleoside-diphosphate kinase